MQPKDKDDKKLNENIESDIKKIERLKKDRPNVFAQTIFLGTLGLVFVLPIIFCAYLGVWLDNKTHGFSFSWTVNLIILGVIIGGVNVYFFIKE